MIRLFLLLVLAPAAWSEPERLLSNAEEPVVVVQGLSDEEDTLNGGESAMPAESLEENLEAIEEGDLLDAGEPPLNWVDTSHAVITNRAQALTEWMDAFFGDPNYNLEQAESFLRLQLINEWDEVEGNGFKVGVRGKVQLPKVSHRLNLLFSGDDGDDLTEEERDQENRVDLQFKVRTGRRSRFDATIGWSSGGLRPGVRYRNEGPVDDLTTYRYIQQLQYADGEKFFATGRLDINHKLEMLNILRWSNRFKWGERSDGVEWRTRLTLRQAIDPAARRPVALAYYIASNGVTRPDSFVKNYRLGVLWRRQVYRDFLFFEMEPSFNYRRPGFEDDRVAAWALLLRLEVPLERDLRRTRMH
jgi:hypothetical protein